MNEGAILILALFCLLHDIKNDETIYACENILILAQAELITRYLIFTRDTPSSLPTSPIPGNEVALVLVPTANDLSSLVAFILE